jgi:hypothetical protein
MAVGPYAEVITVAFESLEMGGGVEWLLPVFTGVPFVVSVGGHARYGDEGWEPGIHSTLFVGSRSFNRGSAYGFALGGFAQGRYAFGDNRQGDVLLGVYVDLALFAVPFVVLVNAFR